MNTFDLNSLILDEVAVNENTCKGLFFRGVVNQYFDGKKLVFKEELRLLKKKSCSGCIQCDSMLDDMHEFQNMVVVEDEIENGALYTANVGNISRDWETGYVDDWNIIITKVKEESK